MLRCLAIRMAAIAGLLVAAPAAATADLVQLFEVPQGAHPHDVAPLRFGKVLYTAQSQGALGVLDSATREVKHIPLGAGSRPHGVIEGPDGAAWITDSGLNAIVRVDVESEEVTSWPLPADRGNVNLNTAAFDGDGILWFTGQRGVYGRLDPATGDIQVFDAPRGRGPYGIAATPAGEVYFASLAGSYIAKIDRATGEAQVIEPPTPAQGARRVWSDSQGRIWVSEWNSGQLSRYDPEAREWAAWKLPGEAPRAYAVYVDERDMVWVSDFSANAVHVFDPRREAFATSYPGSGDNADVRQILGRPGEVWLPESGRDRLMLIRTSGLGLD